MSNHIHAVLLQRSARDSLAEGLRCAVGLSLRGDRVWLWASLEAARALSLALQENPAEPAFVRPVEMLARLGAELYAEEILPHPEFESLSRQDARPLLLRADTCQSW
jgi:hypothetical protein